jgi:tripartite-type tricarboxylate transporter receptor subunit TctC
MPRTLLVASLILSAALFGPAPAAAQYPSKPVRLIVPFAAGGPSDAAARILGRALSATLGQPIVIDNMPGANGAIAARAVRTATADGHTLLWGVGSMVALPLLQKSAAQEVLGDFAAVSMVCQFPFGMAVNATVAAKTVEEFAREARANPGKLGFASATLSEFMAAAQFMKASGTVLTRVPYKGGAQAIPDLVAGRVQAYFTPISLVLPHAQSGALRVLGMLLPQRSPALPDVPSMAEAGMPGVTVPSWQAVFAPPGTPAGIVQVLADKIAAALRDRAVRAEFERMTLAVEVSTPAALTATIGRELET